MLVKFFIASLLLTTTANAAELNCVAKKIYDSSFLEESFSVDEYPDVSVNEDEAYIGSSLFTVEDGAIITSGPESAQDFEVIVIDPNSGFEFLISTDKVSHEGKMYGQRTGDNDASLIADLLCE